MWYLLCIGLARLIVPLVLMLVLALLVYAYRKNELLRYLGCGLIGSLLGVVVSIFLMALLNVTCGIDAAQVLNVLTFYNMVIWAVLGLVAARLIFK